MVGERLKRRLKRRTLEFIARHGYDVDKRATGFFPYRFPKRIQLGSDPLADVQTIIGSDIRCVFDVGAHIGQSAAMFSDAFPAARIHSFEPDSDSYRQLRALVNRCYPRVTPVHAAVGDRDTEASFFINKFSQTNSLLKARRDGGQFLFETDGLDLIRETKVPVMTLDRYCAEGAVERVDFLKIDTQGYELRVLDGARGLLEGQAIPVILLEVSFVPTYEHQPLFPEVYQYLYDRAYRLVWLYENNFRTHLFSISANALFVHERVGSRLRSQPGSAPGAAAAG